MNSNPGKVNLIGLIRDVNGKPKFNDIFNIPDKFWNLLTEKEKEEIEDDRSSHSSST